MRKGADADEAGGMGECRKGVGGGGVRENMNRGMDVGSHFEREWDQRDWRMDEV